MKIRVQNRQRTVALNVPWLRRFAGAALDQCAGDSGDGHFALRNLEEIEVAIVSDRTMARIHSQFMGITGPTDVLTFQHGEIVLSAETALDHARRRGHLVDTELALYIVHGLLHLNGFDDLTPGDAARMRRTQQRILKACLARTSHA